LNRRVEVLGDDVVALSRERIVRELDGDAWTRDVARSVEGGELDLRGGRRDGEGYAVIDRLVGAGRDDDGHGLSFCWMFSGGSRWTLEVFIF
jgi:hypothetical protein